MTQETKIVLNRLGAKNKVLLKWSPGHEGHRGNEVADRLAKLATIDPGTVQNIFSVPTSVCVAIEGIKKWGRDQHKNKWRDTEHAKTLHLIFEGRGENEIAQLINWPRRDLRLFINTLTGQTGLNKLLFAANIRDSPICECGLEVEGNLHFLTICERYARIRYETFCTDKLSNESLGTIHLKDIVKYIRRTKRFDPQETWRITSRSEEDSGEERSSPERGTPGGGGPERGGG